MQGDSKCDKITVRDGRAICPHCGCKTKQRIDPSTVAVNLPLWCYRCGRTSYVKIEYDQTERPESSETRVQRR